MIQDRHGNKYPTVVAAVAAVLAASRWHEYTAPLPVQDLRNLQESLDAIIASAAAASITPELDGAVQRNAA